MAGFPPQYRDMEERLLFNSVGVDGGYTSECWQWIGNRNARDYGRLSMRVNGAYKKLLAHRISYETFKGEIPPGYDVDHECENPWCIAPDHLEAIPAKKNRGELVQRRRRLRLAAAAGQEELAGEHDCLREDDRRAA